MAHQNFEKYASQKSMAGQISSIFEKYFLQTLESCPVDPTILDFGCGDGKYFSFFNKFTPKNNIYGIEISETRINRCKNIGWEKVFQLDNLQPLPFEDNFFDIINFDQVIEHIPKTNIDFYLKEFARVLKPNGNVILVTPNYPIKRIYDFITAIKTKNIKRILDDPTHVSYYNFKKLNSALNPYFKNTRLEAAGGALYHIFKTDYFSHKIIALLQK